jgi:hypothetical protein
VTLTIPAGALSATTTIEVTPDPAGPPMSYAALSSLFRFAPDGLTFATPATVSIEASSAMANARIFWSTAGGGYAPLVTTWSGRTASAAVSHFSSGFVGYASPGAAADASPPLAGLGDPCDPVAGPACRSGQQCTGGICVFSGVTGYYCDTDNDCDPTAHCAGVPVRNVCITAQHTCGCVCVCEFACSECAAPIGQAGDACSDLPVFDPVTSTYSVGCIVSLTCVNGTCQ